MADKGPASIATSETLLPNSTKGYFSVGNVPELAKNWQKTQLHQLLNDPVMQPFTQDLHRQLGEKWLKSHEKIGLSIDDLRGIATGDIPPPPGYSAEDFRIPTLEEALARFPHNLINIELKPDLDGTGDYEQQIADLLRRYGRYTDLIVASFVDEAANNFKAVAPCVYTSVPLNQGTVLVLGALGDGVMPPVPEHIAFQVPPDTSQIGEQIPDDFFLEVVTPDFVADSHAVNLAVQVWTINTCEDMLRMIDLGVDHGCPVVALITAMDRPLGRACGNALEIEESIMALRGEGPADLLSVTYALGAEMLLMGGITRDREEARRKMEVAISSGRAAEKFQQIIAAQGGNPAVVDDPALLPQAAECEIFTAPNGGVVAQVEPRTIGLGIVELGGGRAQVEDRVDPTVGFVITARPGDVVREGEPMATVFARDRRGIELGLKTLSRAIHVGEEAEPPLPLISHRVTEAGVERYES